MERFRKADRLLKVKKSGNGLRGILYKFEWDTSVSPNKCHLVKMESASFNTTDVEVVKRQFGMVDSKFVTSDNYIDVNHRVIWTNDDYDEWERCMKIDYPDEASREEEGIEINYERYAEDCDSWLDDERGNLNKEVNGVIIAFASLGLWDGRHQGAGIIGTNVRDILHSECGYYLDWYCDRYNVRCRASHHDGTNYYLYRVAKDREQAERLKHAIAYEGMTEEEFRKATRSLRPYVAKVYGW
jgi:hypothetical protein